MKHSSLIALSKWVYNVLMFVYLLGYVFFAYLIIDSLYFDGRSSPVDVSRGFSPGFFDAEIFFSALNQSPEGDLLLSEINPGMKLWLLIRATLYAVIIMLLGWHVLRVLDSIGSLKTFYKENVHHFTRMTVLSFAGFLLSCFNFFNYDDSGVTVYFTIAFWPLVLTLFFGVLTVVFKQGNILMEEQNLFV